MDDAAFLDAFLRGSHEGAFGHREHVRAAWTAMRLHGRERGGHLVADGLRRLTAAHGRPERHRETVTGFWLRLVAHGIAEEPEITDFEEFVRRFPLLADAGLLGRRWPHAELAEGRSARRDPDLLPLP